MTIYNGLARLQPHVALSMAMAEALPRRRSEGVAVNPKALSTNVSDTISIPEQTCALGSPMVSGSRYLVTYGLNTCVAIMAHDPDKKVGFMAHANYSHIVLQALAVVQSYKMKSLVIYGGLRSHINSLRVIDYFLSKDLGINLVGIDTAEKYTLGSGSIGLDTETGEVFSPANHIKREPAIKLKVGPDTIDEEMNAKLRYDSPIPIEVFSAMLRQKS